MFELPLDAKINSNDGHAGQSVAVTFNQESRAVSHIIVEDNNGHERLVPLSLVARSSHDEISLNSSEDALRSLPLFKVTEYVERAPQQSGDWAEEEGEWEDSVDVSSFERTDEPFGMPVIVERVPEGEVTLRRGTEIEATDGHVGHVEMLIIEPDSGQITHFVLKKGHLWGKKEVMVPLTAVSSFDYETVYLNVDKETVKNFPDLPK